LSLGKEGAIFVRHLLGKHQLDRKPPLCPLAAFARLVFGKAFFEIYGVAGVV
jgi:hypothetical protein